MGMRMGCVASKPDINDLHANIFQVVNVDDLGHRFSAAKLEVTETDLVLHQRGKSPIRWPLRCLRRYGFDAELFSFESGRRCPTGPGIYAFKCRRAEALFNLLQHQIQSITDDAASRDLTGAAAPLPHPSGPDPRDLVHEAASSGGTSLDQDGYMEPQRPQISRLPNNVGMPTPIVAPGAAPVATVPNVGVRAGGSGAYGGATAVIVGAGGGQCGVGTIHSPASPPTPLSPPPHSFYESRTEEMPPTPGHEAHPPNTPTEPMRPMFMNHIVDSGGGYEPPGLVRPPSFTNSYGDRPPAAHLNSIHNKRPRQNFKPRKLHCNVIADNVYVNVVPERFTSRSRVYENLVHGEPEVPVVPPRASLVAGSLGSGSSHSGTTSTTETEQQASQVNYIMIDLDPGSDSSVAAPTTSPPSSPPEGYAIIDFDKSEALWETAKPAVEHEDGLRKTRHNSTFMCPAPLTRHDSSLSD